MRLYSYLSNHTINHPLDYAIMTHLTQREDMQALDIAQEKIAHCKAKKIPYLNLSDLGLETLPKSISELTWLGALSLSRNHLLNIDAIAPLTNLHKLAFSNNQIESIQVVENFPELKHLFIKENQISGLSPLKNLEKLKKLEANHNNISDLQQITHMEQLVFLDVAHNAMENIDSILKIPSLVWVCIENNPLTPYALKDIAESLPNLRHFTYK